MKAVIIEDMPLARASLKKDLEDYCPEVDILGEAEGVLSGLKLLKDEKPDLIFLDIDLKDGSAFDFIELAGKLKSKIIFTTASDRHAIRAFEVSAVDYLLKPISPQRLKEAVEKAKTIAQEPEQLSLLQSSIKEGSKSKLALHTQKQLRIVGFEEIIRIEAEGNYSMFYLKDESRILVSKTLKEYDQILADHGFFRTHQSHLVNTHYIKSFVKTEGGYLLMKNDARVSVSVRKRSALLHLLEHL